MSLDIKNVSKNNIPLRLDENGSLRKASLFEQYIYSETKESKSAVENVLISQLFTSLYDQPFLAQIEKYAAKRGYHRLSNTAYALRISPLFSIATNRLIDESGNTKGDALSIIRANHLHKIIPQVDKQNLSTAFVILDNILYIRSETGKILLETPDEIDLLLEKLDSEHPHKKILLTLRDNLLAKQIGAFEEYESDDGNKHWDDALIDRIQEELAPFYTYQPIENVPHLSRGVFKDMYYLANGVASHSQRHFRTLPITHRDTVERDTPTFSVVTRLPPYAREPNFWKRLWNILTHLFDRAGHGHSWVELSTPSRGGDERSVVGYYYHALRKERRLQSPDPQRFLPVKDNYLSRETVPISSTQYQKAQRYIEEVQKMLDRTDKKIGDVPLTEGLTEEEKNDITHIYNQAMKSTCLSFANALRQRITGIQCDDRSAVRRTFLPKKLLNFFDTYFNRLWRITNFGFIDHIAWLSRAEFPAYRAAPPMEEAS